MKRILQNNNRDLRREITALRNIIASSKYPPMLAPYVLWLQKFIAQQSAVIDSNFKYLEMNVPEIMSEILERTQSATRNLRILSTKFITPISRYNHADYISICMIKWLHEQHPQSKTIAFAISEGQFSIYPFIDIPVIYYLPSSSQRSLLHLALFFHEYGHFLFQYHKLEMVNLVAELQEKLEEILVQPFQQNDIKSNRDRRRAKKIIETWFDWTEELFCDAVGLAIGGKAFLHTFSLYLRMSGREAFYLTESDLEGSSHPISYIRIKFLVQRARKMGLSNEAKILEDEWRKLADLMSLNQVYHGYYSPSYDAFVNEAIDCMLEEANPIQFNQNRLSFKDKINFVELVNEAWDRYLLDEDQFEQWEAGIFSSFLTLAIHEEAAGQFY